MSLYDELKNSKNPAKDFGEKFSALTMDNRLLVGSVFELTPVCNFRCPFCYARILPEELEARGDRVLSADEWKKLIDDLKTLGAFNLTLTGGECMLHPSFCEIYEYAYDKGFRITILSNASVVTDKILGLFEKKRPYAMYITVYGATPETYKRVCGNSRFYYDVRNNIAALRKLNISVVVQFTADKDNVGEMLSIYEYSKEMGAEFRHSRTLTEFGRCSTEMIDAVAADADEYLEAAQYIWKREKGVDEYGEGDTHLVSVKYVPTLNNPVEKTGIPCNAGRSSCYINHRGELYPCVMLEAFCADTAKKPLSECWRECVEWADNVPALTGCVNCIHRKHCISCVAQHYNDAKQFGVPGPRFCYKLRCPEQAKKDEEEFRKNGYLTIKYAQRDSDKRAHDEQ